MWFKTIIIFLGLFITALISAQTADEIIEKHLEVLGGRKVLKKVNNITITGTMTFSQGANYQEFIFTQIHTKDGRYYFELLNSEGVVLNIRAYDGKIAWSGTREQTQLIRGEEKKEMMGVPFLSRFLEKEKHARAVKYDGLIAGDHSLSMKDQYDTRVTVKIDKDTYQLVGESSSDYEDKSVSVELSNFKTIDGISIPMLGKTRRDLDSDNDPSTSTAADVQRITQRIKTVLINSRIQASKFKRPEN